MDYNSCLLSKAEIEKEIFYKGDFDKRHFRQISVETICNVHKSKFVLTADFSPGST